MNAAIERLRRGNIQVDDCERNYRKGDLGRKKRDKKEKEDRTRERERDGTKKKEKSKERNKDRKVETLRETYKD